MCPCWIKLLISLTISIFNTISTIVYFMHYFFSIYMIALPVLLTCCVSKRYKQFSPSPSSWHCRCLYTAETSPVRLWPEPAECAWLPPPSEPDSPPGNKTPPVPTHQQRPDYSSDRVLTWYSYLDGYCNARISRRQIEFFIAYLK